MNAAGPAGPTTDAIMKAVRTYGGTINPSEYAKFMKELTDNGLTGLAAATENPRKEISVKYLVEKLQAFGQQGGTAVQMQSILAKIKIYVY